MPNACEQAVALLGECPVLSAAGVFCQAQHRLWAVCQDIRVQSWFALRGQPDNVLGPPAPQTCSGCQKAPVSQVCCVYFCGNYRTPWAPYVRGGSLLHSVSGMSPGTRSALNDYLGLPFLLLSRPSLCPALCRCNRPFVLAPKLAHPRESSLRIQGWLC